MRAATITTRPTETTPRRRPSWGKSIAFLRVRLIRAPKPTNLILQNEVIYRPITGVVSAGSILNIIINYDWVYETKYYFKLATKS